MSEKDQPNCELFELILHHASLVEFDMQNRCCVDSCTKDTKICNIMNGELVEQLIEDINEEITCLQGQEQIVKFKKRVGMKKPAALTELQLHKLEVLGEL